MTANPLHSWRWLIPARTFVHWSSRSTSRRSWSKEASFEFTNGAARRVLGGRIEGRDVRFAIRHPQALEIILAHRNGDVDATGVVEPGRSWRLLIRPLWVDTALVRMVDRSGAVSAEKMRVDFVANASHELRTPLSTVLGYAETLAEESDLPEEVRASFGRTIRDEARRMLRIIEDLMSLSRIEADRFVAPRERVDVGEIVATAISNAGHLRGTRSCEFRVSVAENLPPVCGDPAQLVQILDNLISNAVRYGCDKADFDRRRIGGAERSVGAGQRHRPRTGNRSRASAAPHGALLPR